MDHTDSVAASRIRRFLEAEPIVWLSTVRPDGTPHIVPIWFWWDGESLLVFSKPDAQKVRNLRSRPEIMLGVGDAEDDFDIGLLEGRAELLEASTATLMPGGHVDKYAARMTAIGLTPEAYAETYSQVIRIAPSHYLGWHGRTVPQSARLAGAPERSIEEPPIGRPGLREWLGEPLSRGLRGFGLGVGVPRPAGLGAL